MSLDKIKQSYKKAIEQAHEWTSSDISEGRLNKRYENLIVFIETKVQPFAEKDGEFKATVVKDIGNLYELIGDFEKAYFNLEKAKKLFIRLGKPEELAETYALLGDLYRDYGFSKKAINNYEKAIGYCGTIKELQEWKGDSHWGMGDLYRMTGSYQKGLANLEKAELIFKENNLIEGIGHVLWTKGYCYICTSEYQKAESCFNRILDLCNSGKLDETHRASAFGALGDCYRLTGKFETSLDLYQKAEESSEIQEDDSARSWMFAVTGLSYLQLSRVKEATRSVVRAENLAKRIDDKVSLLWTLQARAEVERCEKRFDEAASYYQQTQELAKSRGFKMELAHSFLGLGEVARNTGNEACSFYRKAIKIYRRIGARWGVEECTYRENLIREKPTGHDTKPLNFP